MSGKYGDDNRHWLIWKPPECLTWKPPAPEGRPWNVMPPGKDANDEDDLKWFATWEQACDYVRAQCPIRVPHFPLFTPPAGFYEGRLGQ